MKTSLSQFTGIMLAGTIIFLSCKKSNDTKQAPVEAKSVSNLIADAALTGGHFAFYSLESNQEIPYTDSASGKWDIAFRSTTMLVNGGTSGPGAGGAFVQTGTTFSDYAQIPVDSTFKTDNKATAFPYAIPTGSGNGWYNYNTTTNVITPIPGRILAIRTATGKYAKIEITSYYKDAPSTPDAATNTPRYYNFRFSYQPDGSRKF